MTEKKKSPRELAAELSARRTESYKKVDDQINAELFRLALGDQAEAFQTKPGQLLPLSVLSTAFKGRRPISVILRGQEIPAPTWKQTAFQILKDCDSIPECHERLMNLRGQIHARYRPLLAESPEGMDKPMKVSDGLYWEGRQDVKAMMQSLTEQILKNAGYDDWAVVVRCGGLQQKTEFQDERMVSLGAAPGSFVGRKPQCVILRGDEIMTPTWKKVITAVLRDCAQIPECHERLMNLRGFVMGREHTLLAETPEGMHSPVEISEGLYWETRYDTETLVRLLTKRILDDVGYDYQGIAVKCRDVRQDAVLEEAPVTQQETGPVLSM